MALRKETENMNSGITESERNSVCMAAYNGMRFIKKQLDSILAQIGENDEVIIVDDGSKDGTPDFIRQIADPRIKLYVNEKNLGVIKTFGKAISLASGKYIFLTDQDDIWTEGRYQLMLNTLKREKVMLVTGNLATIDIDDNKSDVDIGRVYARDSKAYDKNILKIFTGKAFYYGCAMAFDSRLRDLILPFPDDIESHDLWIAMAANYIRSNIHLDEDVLLHRIHGVNVTDYNRSISEKLHSRTIMVSMLRILRSRSERLQAQKGE